MSVYADVMPIGLAELRMDVRIFSKKLMTAYLDLVAYLHRWGSVPSNEKSLAGVMNVTVRYLQEVAWPFLEVRLEMSDDGQRYFDPDISAVRPPRSGMARPQAKIVPPELSEARRRAAQASHAARQHQAAGEADFAPPAGANGVQSDANRLQTTLQTDAKLSAKSSPVASVLHDRLQDFAGFAGDIAGAPSPSLSSFPSLQPTEGQPERKEVREREDADAGGRVDVQTVQTALQNSVQTDANRDAKPDAKPRREKEAPPPPRKVPLPDDWQPTAEAVAKIKASGRDPDHMAAAFRFHYKAVGATRADWDAAYEAWQLKQPQFDPPPRQLHATMAIPGGKSGSQQKGEWLSKAMRRRGVVFGDEGKEEDDRIIEGKLG